MLTSSPEILISRFCRSRLNIGANLVFGVLSARPANGLQVRTPRFLQMSSAASGYFCAVVEYLNDSFYRKGLLKREVLQDAQGRPFTETENSYQLRDVATGAVTADSGSA